MAKPSLTVSEFGYVRDAICESIDKNEREGTVYIADELRIAIAKLVAIVEQELELDVPEVDDSEYEWQCDNHLGEFGSPCKNCH